VVAGQGATAPAHRRTSVTSRAAFRRFPDLAAEVEHEAAGAALAAGGALTCGRRVRLSPWRHATSGVRRCRTSTWTRSPSGVRSRMKGPGRTAVADMRRTTDRLLDLDNPGHISRCSWGSVRGRAFVSFRVKTWRAAVSGSCRPCRGDCAGTAKPAVAGARWPCRHGTTGAGRPPGAGTPRRHRGER
jgi:hypothetical protein